MSTSPAPVRPAGTPAQHLGRVVLGSFVLVAGVAHLTWLRADFQAQVPSWVPLDEDLVVVASGVVEIALGAAYVALPRRRRLVGGLLAAFLVAIFPGNVAQWVEGVDAFGLDTDAERLLRLPFQPLLVAWALWAGGWWERGPRRRADQPA